MAENKTLALFDFDGTITTKDTFLEFIKFACGKTKFWLGMWLMSPVLILHLLKLIRNDKAKTFVFDYFFSDWTYNEFKNAGEDFCKTKVSSLIRPKGLEKIKWHQQQGHRIIVITASMKEWVAPWCRSMNIEILATEAEVKHDKITGKLGSANCYGQEKVERLNKHLSLSEYTDIYAYGDSSGDKELLSLTQYSHFKPFRD